MSVDTDHENPRLKPPYLFILGITKRKSRDYLILLRLGQILNCAVGESGPLRVTAHHKLRVRTLRRCLLDQALHLPDASRVGASTGKVGRDKSAVLDALNSNS